MKIKKEEKMTAMQINFNVKKEFIRLHQKTGWTNFDELWVTDSTLNEGNNSLETSKLDPNGLFVVSSRITSAIKFAMSGIHGGADFLHRCYVYVTGPAKINHVVA